MLPHAISYIAVPIALCLKLTHTFHKCIIRRREISGAADHRGKKRGYCIQRLAGRFARCHRIREYRQCFLPFFTKISLTNTFQFSSYLREFLFVCRKFFIPLRFFLLSCFKCLSELGERLLRNVKLFFRIPAIKFFCQLDFVLRREVNHVPLQYHVCSDSHKQYEFEP